MLVPERHLSPEQQQRVELWEKYRGVLSAVIATAQAELWGDSGVTARDYLHGRGFTDDDMKVPMRGSLLL